MNKHILKSALMAITKVTVTILSLYWMRILLILSEHWIDLL